MTVWIEAPFDNLPAEGFRRQRYWMMAEAFVRAGHDVTYFTSDFNHGTKAPRRLVSALRTPGIEVVLVPTPPYRRNVSLRRILSHRAYARAFARHAAGRQSPAVVIAATPTLGAAAAALRLARRCGARFVLDIQDAWPETFLRLLPGGLKWTGRLLFAPLFRKARRLYREADLVTGVSARYRALSGRDDYRLAYLGVPPQEPPAEGRVRGATRLVYAGSLGNGYDLGTVIEAVRRNPALTLDIAGSGPLEPRWRAMANARTRFHGYLPDAELRRLLASCDVGVIPMRDDSWVGLPNKLGDYLAAGLRVVSSLHGECGELLARAHAGTTYDFGSADSLLRALETLPASAVELPDCLRAERIYARYANEVANCLRV